MWDTCILRQLLGTSHNLLSLLELGVLAFTKTDTAMWAPVLYTLGALLLENLASAKIRFPQFTAISPSPLLLRDLPIFPHVRNPNKPSPFSHSLIHTKSQHIVIL